MPDPMLYTELLKHACLAAKYVEPKAAMVLGWSGQRGGSPGPARDACLQTIYEADGREYSHAVGRHLYTASFGGIDVLV